MYYKIYVNFISKISHKQLSYNLFFNSDFNSFEELINRINYQKAYFFAKAVEKKANNNTLTKDFYYSLLETEGFDVNCYMGGNITSLNKEDM